MRAVTEQDVANAKTAVVQAKRERAEHAAKLAGQIATAAWILETVVLESLLCVAIVRWLRSGR